MNAQDTKEKIETMIEQATAAIQNIVDAARPGHRSMGSWELAGALTGAIVGGAVIGGAAAALLVPTSGPELRKRIGGFFQEAREKAMEAQERVTESVKRTGESVMSEVSSLRGEDSEDEGQDQQNASRERNSRRHAHA